MQCFVVGLPWFDQGGAGRGRQGREGRVAGGIASGLEKFYYVFFFFGFFLIIVLMWKIVRVSKASVLYIHRLERILTYMRQFY